LGGTHEIRAPPSLLVHRIEMALPLADPLQNVAVVAHGQRVDPAALGLAQQVARDEGGLGARDGGTSGGGQRGG
jgi:hypothetical protein